MSQPDVGVYFVEDKSGRQAQLMVNAFTWMSESKLVPKWVKFDDVLAMEHVNSDSVYVVEEFKGTIFDHLMKIKALVVGHLCILKTTFNGSVIDSLPSNLTSDNPVFSKCMYGMKVCTTNMEKKDKDVLEKLIKRMSGQYTNHFSNAVTHLITNKIGTSKYYAAGKHKIPIMKPDWVYQCWQRHQFGLAHAQNKKLIDNYKLSVFQGLVICPTQITDEERKKLKELVESNGGKFDPTMTKDTKCLLLKREQFKTAVNNGNAKIKYAKNFSIPCLDIKWAYNSVEANYSLPYNSYLLFGNVNDQIITFTSLKTESASSSKDSSQSSRRRSSTSTNSNNDEEMRENCTSGTLPRRFDCLTIDPSILTMTFEDVKLRFHQFEEYKSDILDGCTICFIGFSSEIVHFIRKLAINCGSMVQEKINENVTHAIVTPNQNDINIKDINELISTYDNCKFVKLDWLNDCLKSKECVDYLNYSIELNNQEKPKFDERKFLKRIQITEDSNDSGPDSSKKKFAAELLKESELKRQSQGQKSNDNSIGFVCWEFRNPECDDQPSQLKCQSNSQITKSQST